MAFKITLTLFIMFNGHRSPTVVVSENAYCGCLELNFRLTRGSNRSFTNDYIFCDGNIVVPSLEKSL